MTDLYNAVLSIAPDYSVDSKELLMIVVYHCRKSKVKPQSFYFSLKEAPEGSEAHNLYLTMQECPETLGDLLEKAQQTINHLKTIPKKNSDGIVEPSDFMTHRYLEIIPRIKAMSLRRKELLITSVFLIIGSGVMLTLVSTNLIENTMRWVFTIPSEALEYRRR